MRPCRADRRSRPARAAASSAGGRSCGPAGPGPVRLVTRPGGTIGHPGRPFVAVPVSPLDRCLPRHVERPGWRPAVIDNQTRQPQPGARGQGSISVGHEGPLGAAAVPRQLHSTPGGPSPPQNSDRVVTRSRPTCLDITASSTTCADSTTLRRNRCGLRTNPGRVAPNFHRRRGTEIPPPRYHRRYRHPGLLL